MTQLTLAFGVEGRRITREMSGIRTGIVQGERNAFGDDDEMKGGENDAIDANREAPMSNVIDVVVRDVVRIDVVVTDVIDVVIIDVAVVVVKNHSLTTECVG